MCVCVHMCACLCSSAEVRTGVSPGPALVSAILSTTQTGRQSSLEGFSRPPPCVGGMESQAHSTMHLVFI